MAGPQIALGILRLSFRLRAYGVSRTDQDNRTTSSKVRTESSVEVIFTYIAISFDTFVDVCIVGIEATSCVRFVCATRTPQAPSRFVRKAVGMRWVLFVHHLRPRPCMLNDSDTTI